MSHTYTEIHNQPASWGRTLPSATEQWTRIAGELPIESGTHFLFIGCGTSLYIAQSAAHVFQEITGHVSIAVPGSEVFLSSASVIPKHVPVVAFAISRSGSTSEVLMAVDHLKRHFENAQIVGITCNPTGKLAQNLKYTIELPHASEKSVVMTQSHTNMLLALQIVAGIIAGNDHLLGELQRLPDLLQPQLQAYESFASGLGRDPSYTSFVYLGLGPNYGLAMEGTLKLKEMTQTPCEAYNPLEFRHGPISTVGRGTTVVLLSGDRERAFVSDVESDVKRYGAYVATLAPYHSEGADLGIELPHLSDASRCVLYLPPLQLLAYYRALTLGLNPDRPRHLDQVVVLHSG